MKEHPWSQGLDGVDSYTWLGDIQPDGLPKAGNRSRAAVSWDYLRERLRVESRHDNGAAIGSELGMQAVTVSVEYDDLLDITLPRMMRAFGRVIVVTSHSDFGTQAVADKHGAICYQTNAFYRDGAVFNKGRAIEEAFDSTGRQGWLCVIDADVLLPKEFAWGALHVGKLYVPRRRMQPDITQWDIEDWSGLELRREEHGGWMQVFHAKDAVLETQPWYNPFWKHAGGCDSSFQLKWAAKHKRWLLFQVMHLGLDGVNWCGRVTDRLDGNERHPSVIEARKKNLRHFIESRKRHKHAVERLDGKRGARD